jgi:hypothetical protein
MADYPFPKPYLQQPGNTWVVKTLSGVKTFTDPELAWSAYYFARLNYLKKAN